MLSYAARSNAYPDKKEIPLEVLKDKIKGGWAGQTIGVTYGGPTEFKFNGTMIQDYTPIPWYDGYLKETMEDIPGLYDDIYMDLTFVEVFERLGLDAPVDSFAHAFAHADYKLWHANQAARYNILQGMKAPECGHWLNNPHADDIDYQIESDYAGLMTPGMPNAASAISDKIGHIMNYGDGWYGGVYVGAMYSLAFLSDDINFVVKEALRTIPEESEFYQCMADVIKWHNQYPNDWKQTWFELEKKWSSEIGCPDGVFAAFNIDAKINAAYILMGLLYGNGDYGKTMEIATRAGQDSDCNPSNAAGILGTMIGYSNIPAYWKMGLSEIENMNFKYTDMSLNRVYDISYKHALEMIKKNGGKITNSKAIIKVQVPEKVRFEKSFENMYPVSVIDLKSNIQKELEFEFEGTGFVLRGSANKVDKNAPEVVLEATLFIDGVKIETAVFPTDFTTRRHELFWKYQLPKGKHKVKIVTGKIPKGYYLRALNYLVYSDTVAKSVNY
ncbi:MAG: ADP-ribosylglycohydrolase family protein [Paludibacter sp.]|nr:ADP-ribosylglycohydrolase family protein [Paludibacter sp.]